MPALTKEQLDELREDFDFNDGNHDGRIDYDEFAELVDLLDEDIEESALRIGFGEIDTDHDGAITFDEFVEWWATD